ncbi:MAG: Na+/H+ antiporter subunit E [Clostridia bacterium]|nr:Na+/H+ antiporter subunit E [Clostridia bacterium]
MYLLLFGIWLLLNGSVTPEICLFGAGLTAGLGLLAYALFGYTPKKDLQFLCRVPLFLVFLPVLLFEILKANGAVIRLVLRKKIPAAPTLVVVDTGLKTRFAQFMMANAITLTPGTITVRTAGSRVTVHCLRREYAEGLESGVLCRLLHRMEA